MSRPPLALTDHQRLIFALDVANRDEALHWIRCLGDSVGFYKLGMELLASGDYFVVLDELARLNKRIFVDLKFFDIPATIAGVVKRLGQWSVDYCTLHGWHPAMLEAAVAANQASQMRLLAITVLTSMDQSDLAHMGIHHPAQDVVIQRARAAHQAGMDGVVASGQEAAAIRHAIGADFSIVCPGIRPASQSSTDDQRRTVSVAQAIANGADAIVVGRPIRHAADPRAAAYTITQEITAARNHQA